MDSFDIDHTMAEIDKNSAFDLQTINNLNF